jgi:hypothetical protein
MYRSGSVIEGPDYLYYDLTVTNRSTSNSFNNNHLVFKDSRQSVLIQNPEDYLLSVVRFQLDTTSLPVHRFEVVPNQNNPNFGIYSVTMEYFTDAVTSIVGQPEELLWTAVNLDIPVPLAPSLTPSGYQVDSPYYYSYSFEHIIRLTNDALLRALDKLKALVYTGAIDDVDEPYLAWNTDRQSASLFCFKGAFNQKVYPHIKIYFNRPLYFLFNSFPVIELSHDISKNRNYLLVVLGSTW